MDNQKENVTNVTKNERESTRRKKALFIKKYFLSIGNISRICKTVNISRQQYYRWLENDEKFKQAIRDEEAGLIDLVESQAFILIIEKNPTMIKYFLQTRGKDRGYVDK